MFFSISKTRKLHLSPLTYRAQKQLNASSLSLCVLWDLYGASFYPINCFVAPTDHSKRMSFKPHLFPIHIRSSFSKVLWKKVVTYEMIENLTFHPTRGFANQLFLCTKFKLFSWQPWKIFECVLNLSVKNSFGSKYNSIPKWIIFVFVS